MIPSPSPWDSLINGLPKLSFPGMKSPGQPGQTDANGNYVPSEEEDAALSHLASQTIQPYRPGWAALPGVGASIVGGLAIRQMRENARLRAGADRAAMTSFMGAQSLPPAPTASGTVTAPSPAAPSPQPPQPVPQFRSAPEGRPALMGGSTPAAPAPSLPQTSPGPQGLPSVAGTSVGSPPPMTPPTAQPQAPPQAQPQPAQPPVRVNKQVEEINRQLGSVNDRLRQVQMAYASAGTDRQRQFILQQMTALQGQAQALNTHLLTVADPVRDVQMQLAEMQVQEHQQKVAAAERQSRMIESFLQGGDGLAAPGQAPAVSQQQTQSAAPPTATGIISRQNGAGALPPGMYPGGMISQPDVEGSMVPLSPEAQRYKRMMELGGLTGNKALEMAGKQGLDADPSYEARKAQSVDMGKSAAVRAEAKRAGAQILKSFAKLEHSFDTADDPTLLGAIGPYNTTPYAENHIPGPELFTAPGMTPPQAAAAYRGSYRPVSRNGNPDSWDLQNLFSHDVHGITTSVMMNAGRGLNPSDKRQEAIDSAMRDFMKSTDRKSAKQVLDHARNIIINDYGLTQEEANAVLAHERATLMQGGGEHGAAPSNPARPAGQHAANDAVGSVRLHPQLGEIIKSTDGRWYPLQRDARGGYDAMSGVQ